MKQIFVLIFNLIAFSAFSQLLPKLEYKTGFYITYYNFDSIYKIYSINKKEFIDDNNVRYSIIIHDLDSCLIKNIPNLNSKLILKKRGKEISNFWQNSLSITKDSTNSFDDFEFLTSDRFYNNENNVLVHISKVKAEVIILKKVSSILEKTSSFCSIKINRPFIYFIRGISNTKINSKDKLVLKIKNSDIKRIKFLECY